jgi:hypothetical protein
MIAAIIAYWGAWSLKLPGSLQQNGSMKFITCFVVAIFPEKDAIEHFNAFLVKNDDLHTTSIKKPAQRRAVRIKSPGRRGRELLLYSANPTSLILTTARTVNEVTDGVCGIKKNPGTRMCTYRASLDYYNCNYKAVVPGASR